MYQNLDTGELWTKEEIEEAYRNNSELVEQYQTFENYFEHLLELGREHSGGIVEA